MITDFQKIFDAGILGSRFLLIIKVNRELYPPPEASIVRRYDGTIATSPKEDISTTAIIGRMR